MTRPTEIIGRCLLWIGVPVAVTVGLVYGVLALVAYLSGGGGG